MTMRSRGLSGGKDQFSIYDAAEPWGPWTTVYYEDSGYSFFGVWGESQHIPSKWISPDGESFYLVFSGDDSFAVREATLTIEYCSGDFEPADGDVDGSDLAAFITNSEGVISDEFAADFGRVNCPFMRPFSIY
jgi:hypothetical protein